VNGLLVPPRDHHALKNADRRRRLRDAGFARVDERFTVEKMVAATADVYARLRTRAAAESGP